MPPRLPFRRKPSTLPHLTPRHQPFRQPSRQCRCATTAAASTITPAPPLSQIDTSVPPLTRYPPTQPPSHKPPEFRKSQLLRQYTSLLRSVPLLVLFQHNAITSSEWMGLRRELSKALQKVDDTQPDQPPLASTVNLQILQTGIFDAALRIVEFYQPPPVPVDSNAQSHHPTDPRSPSSATIPNVTPSPMDPAHTHDLSTTAHTAAMSHKRRRVHPLTPLLAGSLAALVFPTVSPVHLKAALSIVSPSPPTFRAPTRRANPGYHDAAVQSGVQKLLMLGARVEGRVLDKHGVEGVGKIEGGIDGLRAMLVGMLQGVSGGVVGVLEGTGRGLYFTVEGRRSMLEEQEKGAGENTDHAPEASSSSSGSP
ncbi:MAG: hypothetical protein M1833_001052 [Piccolia ochrophora]|nr:MAG: hypothetical protein M1833_001052 [Piccolia ochrophora]